MHMFYFFQPPYTSLSWIIIIVSDCNRQYSGLVLVVGLVLSYREPCKSKTVKRIVRHAICPMALGIFCYICLKCMIHISKYSVYGAFGFLKSLIMNPYWNNGSFEKDHWIWPLDCWRHDVEVIKHLTKTPQISSCVTRVVWFPYLDRDLGSNILLPCSWQEGWSLAKWVVCVVFQRPVEVLSVG